MPGTPIDRGTTRSTGPTTNHGPRGVLRVKIFLDCLRDDCVRTYDCAAAPNKLTHSFIQMFIACVCREENQCNRGPLPNILPLNISGLSAASSAGGSGAAGEGGRLTGGAAIAMALDTNYSLTHLDLGWNKVAERLPAGFILLFPDFFASFLLLLSAGRCGRTRHRAYTKVFFDIFNDGEACLLTSLL